MSSLKDSGLLASSKKEGLGTRQYMYKSVHYTMDANHRKLLRICQVDMHALLYFNISHWECAHVCLASFPTFNPDMYIYYRSDQKWDRKDLVHPTIRDQKLDMQSVTLLI